MSLNDHFILKINQHKGLINKVVFLYADDHEDRNDLRQEIISQAWKSFKSFRGESLFSTWLYRVSINVAISVLRQSKRSAKM
ncbi:MAG: sigma factor, partial [Bacteroidota bacterium]